MANFLIGLIAGISLAVLLGWIGKNTGEIKQLRSENLELKEANQELMRTREFKLDPTRALAQPARPVGASSKCNKRPMGLGIE